MLHLRNQLEITHLHHTPGIMRKSIFFLILLSINSYAQESILWGNLKSGPYKVGYHDTLIYNNALTYQLLDYKGPKPHFVSLWFPAQEQATRAHLTFGDYFHIKPTYEIQKLCDSVFQQQKKSFINYGIQNRLDSWEGIRFNAEGEQLVSQLFQTQICASRSVEFPQESLPVIIYHHGMGGSKMENAILFEYLASYGFVIVSSNFHWPNQGISTSEIQNDLRFTIDFATNLPFTSSREVYFLGHSWGAQTGLTLNQQGHHDIQTFILLDNTLEALSPIQVNRYYPVLDSLLKNHPMDFQTKSYVITARKAYLENNELIIQPDPKFEVFKNLDTEVFSYLLGTKILNHEAFVSSGVIRTIFNQEYPQIDSIAAREQFDTYQELNRDILHLLRNNQVRDNSPFQTVSPD